MRKGFILMFLGLLSMTLLIPTVSAIDPVSGLSALFGGACCFFVFIPIIIWIILAVWVYKDAQKRDGNGVLWLVIVLLTGIVGLIVWLIVRPPIGSGSSQSTNIFGSEPSRRCPSCGRGIPNDAQVCPYCGKRFHNF